MQRGQARLLGRCEHVRPSEEGAVEAVQEQARSESPLNYFD